MPARVRLDNQEALVTYRQFRRFLIAEFTGVGNEWDEPEDVQEFKKGIPQMWSDLLRHRNRK